MSRDTPQVVPSPHTPIIRGEGTTPSERYLARLAEQSFLNLWCYPNVFLDKRAGGSGDGIELCDLLVVCGDNILIFSDKSNAWPSHPDVQVSWKRWARKAIAKSVRQIRGAERMIAKYPERIFIDAACTNPLPITLPSPDSRRVHGIAVALGAGDACRAFFKGGSGSFAIDPDIHGSGHWDGDEVAPFVVGDVDPEGSFIHVLDDATLDIVLRELDTITDFTTYLSRKERFIRAGHLFQANGEEDLVAHYMTHTNANGDHDFTFDDGREPQAGEQIAFVPGIYNRMRENRQYVAMRAADQNSYIWDSLINTFTRHILAGTNVVLDGQPRGVSEFEESVRQLALVRRFHRRSIGEAVMDCLRRSSTATRFCRTILPDPGDPNGAAFFIMTLDPTRIVEARDYAHYRNVRIEMLKIYAFAELHRNRTIRKIVGIALEPPTRQGRDGGSEDLLYVEPPTEWTDAFVAELEDAKQTFNIMQPSNERREFAVHAREFPELPDSDLNARRRTRLNRHQRRKRDAEARRRR